MLMAVLCVFDSERFSPIKRVFRTTQKKSLLRSSDVRGVDHAVIDMVFYSLVCCPWLCKVQKEVKYSAGAVETECWNTSSGMQEQVK